MDQERPPQIAPRPLPSEGDSASESLGPSRLTKADWIQLAIGFGIAIAFILIPMLNWMGSYLSILVHELGHWVAGMLFGYPSIPAFDFQQGGGVTMQQERSSFALACVYLVALLPFVWLRRNRLGLAVWGGVVVLFAVAAHTSLHNVLLLSAGHGFEVLIAGVFLYRAWANASINTSSERPLYAALGLFMVWHVLVFAWQVIHDVDTRADYMVGRVYCENDFVRIQNMTGVSMNTWLWLLMLCALGAVALSFLAFRYQRVWRSWVWRLILPESE